MDTWLIAILIKPLVLPLLGMLVLDPLFRAFILLCPEGRAKRLLLFDVDRKLSLRWPRRPRTPRSSIPPLALPSPHRQEPGR